MTGALKRFLLNKVRGKYELVKCLPESYSVAFGIYAVRWMSYQTAKIVPTKLLGELS